MRPAGPIDVTGAYERLHRELTELLASLSPEEWQRPVPDSRWTVREVAAHLLDGDLRRLSLQRDHHTLPVPASGSYEDLVAYLDRLNAEWLAAARRLSPRVLRELLSWSGEEVARLFAAIDPDSPALFSVAWAGEEASAHWFDVAREYTEKWVHQQQIRDAVGRPRLGEARPELLRPVIDTFFRALPHAWRGMEAPPGTAVALRVEGEGGGRWALVREGEGWKLFEGETDEPGATLAMSADTAWRALATRRQKARYLERIAITGDPELARGFAQATAVMA